MRFFNTKKGLFTLGIIAGLGAALLAYLGNPKNMAFCIACFISRSYEVPQCGSGSIF